MMFMILMATATPLCHYHSGNCVKSTGGKFLRLSRNGLSSLLSSASVAFLFRYNAFLLNILSSSTLLNLTDFAPYS